MTTSMSACPACSAAPLAELQSAKGYRGNGAAARRIMLSLPTAHCAACITSVESGLATQPGVRSARVNLTLKRATVEADADTDPKALAAYLGRIGFAAYALDPGPTAAHPTATRPPDIEQLGVRPTRRHHQ